MPDNAAEAGEKKRERLTAVERTRELHPWRRAHQLNWCFLYWIPVSSFPIRTVQRQWLMVFFDRLIAVLTEQFELRPELFLQYKVIYPSLMKSFLNNSMELNPVLGLSRRPGATIPEPISEGDIRALSEGKKFDFNEFVADYVYWFVNKSERKQRELFFGHGGMTAMFLKPDPQTKPPEVPFSPAVRKQNIAFQVFDVDGLVAQSFALMDGFLAKSKDFFGAGLETDPQFPGIRFILPLLSTHDFFDQPLEEKDKWFQLFDVYVNESPRDNGVLVASKLDIEHCFVTLVAAMRKEGFQYPET